MTEKPVYVNARERSDLIEKSKEVLYSEGFSHYDSRGSPFPYSTRFGAYKQAIRSILTKVARTNEISLGQVDYLDRMIKDYGLVEKFNSHLNYKDRERVSGLISGGLKIFPYEGLDANAKKYFVLLEDRAKEIEQGKYLFRDVLLPFEKLVAPVQKVLDKKALFDAIFNTEPIQEGVLDFESLNIPGLVKQGVLEIKNKYSGR